MAPGSDGSLYRQSKTTLFGLPFCAFMLSCSCCITLESRPHSKFYFPRSVDTWRYVGTALTNPHKLPRRSRQITLTRPLFQRFFRVIVLAPHRWRWTGVRPIGSVPVSLLRHQSTRGCSLTCEKPAYDSKRLSKPLLSLSAFVST